MRIVKNATLRSYWEKHPDSRRWLKIWLLTVQQSDWKNIQEVRKTYPHADSAKVASGSLITIFNVCKNKYRLIVAIHYNKQLIYIRDFLTHAEYDKQLWKDRH